MAKKRDSNAASNMTTKMASAATGGMSSDMSDETSVARVTEIIASSPNSFDDAVKTGVARATKTLKNVKSAWVKDMQVKVRNDQIAEYRVILNVTFVLMD